MEAFLRWSWMVLWGACAGPADRSPPIPPPPSTDTASPGPGNILLIVADDLGIDKLSAYDPPGDTGTLPTTPNIDRLAATGVRFDNAWSAPACSPTRSWLLTGRYGRRTGVGRPYDVVEARVLPYHEITVPEYLDAAAETPYRHALLGKWHLTSQDGDYADSPRLHGFQYHAGSIFNFTEPSLTGQNTTYYSWEKATNGELSWVEDYATSDTADDAVAQIETLPEPWLLWVAFNAPHIPFHSPPASLLPNGDCEQSNRALFHCAIEAMDTEIGRVLAAMPPEVAANTTVIFIGDNGTPDKVASAYINGKGTLYEGGIHVPLIVSGPLVRDPGTASTVLVSATDFFATAAEIAGAPPPSDVAEDSVSWVPYLLDPALPSQRDYNYSEKFIPNGPGPYTFHARALRDERWKVIFERHADQKDVWRLFDLALDPWGETDLLATELDATQQEAFERLSSALDADYPPLL